MLQVTWSVLVSRWRFCLWTAFLISPRKVNTTNCLTSFTSQTGEGSRDWYVHATLAATWQDWVFVTLEGKSMFVLFSIWKTKLANNHPPTLLSDNMRKRKTPVKTSLYDVTAAILVFWNNETAVMSVCQTKLVRVKARFSLKVEDFLNLKK